MKTPQSPLGSLFTSYYTFLKKQLLQETCGPHNLHQSFINRKFSGVTAVCVLYLFLFVESVYILIKSGE